ncbi:hypothetical protein FB451DRAFT_1184020 [Mycena latifolia]|nr:hypothetical protein FB451DRAFT_1184020 [Mycena latifolia]
MRLKWSGFFPVSLVYRVSDRDKNAAKHRKHGHMHTRAEPGLDTDLAEGLEANFTWKPPLLIENITDDVDMCGIEEMSEEEINAAFESWDADLAAEWAAREALLLAKQPIDVGLVYDYTELDNIDSVVLLVPGSESRKEPDRTHHSSQYPMLASDYLAVQGSAMASKRAFLNWSLSATPHRNRLAPDMSQALQLVKVLFAMVMLGCRADYEAYHCGTG